MSAKHNFAMAVLTALGVVLILAFGWQLRQNARRSRPDVNPYAGIAYPELYAESPREGASGAKLVWFEYGDFACPACGSMQGVVAQIFAKYGDRTLHIWKDFPLHGEVSEKAAVAARCAARENKFWPYHDWLFKEQANLDKIDYDAGAALLGLDQAEFLSCLDDKNIMAQVERDSLEAQALGVDITPTFVVGERAFSGAVSYEDFESVIVEELGKIR